ncbi:MAG: CPBP family glutamic-type intramembrane protease [Nitritalea sp.]
MKQRFLELYHFLQAPYQADVMRPPTFRAFFSLLLLTFLVVIPYAAILELFDLEDLTFAIEELMRESPWLVLLLAVVAAPLLEEPTFRLYQDFRIRSLLVAFGLSFLFIGSGLWVLLLFWCHLVYLFYRIKTGNPPGLKGVVWISSVLFALVHIGNFEGIDWSQQFYLIPILVGAQFLMGLVLSYIRLQNGMLWAMLFHGTYNACLVIPALLFQGME